MCDASTWAQETTAQWSNKKTHQAGGRRVCAPASIAGFEDLRNRSLLESVSTVKHREGFSSKIQLISFFFYWSPPHCRFLYCFLWQLCLYLLVRGPFLWYRWAFFFLCSPDIYGCHDVSDWRCRSSDLVIVAPLWDWHVWCMKRLHISLDELPLNSVQRSCSPRGELN